MLTSTIPQTAVIPHATPGARKTWLDAARAAAIVAVVVIHVASAAMSSGRGSSWFAAMALNAASRWAVPFFIMISGALLLNPSREESPGEFYRRRLMRIGLPLIFWSVFYLCWRRFFLHEHLSLKAACRDCAFGRPYFHLYFLFLIAGLYLVTPLLRVYIKAQPPSRQFGAALIALAWAASITVLSVLFPHKTDALAVEMFVPYIGYYLIGHVIASHGLPAACYRRGMLLFIGSVIVAIAGAALLERVHKFNRGFPLFNRYTGPVVIAMSIGLFAAFVHHAHNLATESRPLPAIVRWLSEASFGIFLIHPAFMDLFHRFHASYLRPHAIVAIPFWVAVILVASLVATRVAQKIPGLRAVFG